MPIGLISLARVGQPHHLITGKFRVLIRPSLGQKGLKIL